MRIPRRLALIASLLGAGACQADVAPSRPQWVVTLSTDAPVPQFGDRLLVEILDAEGDACSGCRRLFDASAPARWPLSFGVTADGAAARVRARLFRAATLGSDGQPTPRTTIDAIVELGEPGPVGVQLAMACFGHDADVVAGTACDAADGVDRPVDEIPTDGGSLLVGSWPPAQRTPCGIELPAGTACVEGGAFLLGSGRTLPLEEESTTSRPERIVVLSAFALDHHELTVGELRTLRLQHPGLGEPAQPGVPTVIGSQYCNYRGPDSDERDAYPLNCVDHALAEEICERRGMRLPSEAEWEFAAGNAVRETTFPWGEDEDVCAHAVLARNELSPSVCRDTGEATLPPGSVPSPGTDATDLGLQDLAGNLTEWTRERFTPYGQGCWTPTVLVDPLCDTGSDASARGGNWTLDPSAAAAPRRHAFPRHLRSVAIGVRCAIDG